MPILELTDQQVVDLVRQLPPERQRTALLALAAGASERRAQRFAHAEAELRKVCAARGVDWDKMSEGQRETLLDDLVHEDRPCGS